MRSPPSGGSEGVGHVGLADGAEAAARQEFLAGRGRPLGGLPGLSGADDAQPGHRTTVARGRAGGVADRPHDQRRSGDGRPHQPVLGASIPVLGAQAGPRRGAGDLRHDHGPLRSHRRPGGGRGPERHAAVLPVRPDPRAGLRRGARSDHAHGPGLRRRCHLERGGARARHGRRRGLAGHGLDSRRPRGRPAVGHLAHGLGRHGAGLPARGSARRPRRPAPRGGRRAGRGADACAALRSPGLALPRRGLRHVHLPGPHPGRHRLPRAGPPPPRREHDRSRHRRGASGRRRRDGAGAEHHRAPLEVVAPHSAAGGEFHGRRRLRPARRQWRGRAPHCRGDGDRGRCRHRHARLHRRPDPAHEP